MRNFIVAIALVAAGGMVNCDAIDDIAEAAGLDTDLSAGSCGFSASATVSSESVEVGTCLHDIDEYIEGEVEVARTARENVGCEALEVVADAAEDEYSGGDEAQCESEGILGACRIELSYESIGYTYDVNIYASSSEGAETTESTIVSAGDALCSLLGGDWTATNE